MPALSKVVLGGVDTHKDLHVAAVVDPIGRVLATASFPTGRVGYGQLLDWMANFGNVVRIGVEGTGAYGAGLARFLSAQGVAVVEVNRPNRQARRKRGKSDTTDAEAAARAALNGEASVVPKDSDGIVESIRVLRVAFCSARASRTRIANQIRDLIVTAPDRLRTKLDPLSTDERVAHCMRMHLTGDVIDPSEAMKVALKSLSRQYESLTEEMAELHGRLDRLTAQANADLRGRRGVGVDVAAILLVAAGDNPERVASEAAFAALCGSSPVEASSGKTVRHRLNRGGNRQANHALWRIAMVRMTCDEETKAYVARRKAEGKSDREITRCLKRFIAREIYRCLVAPQDVPHGVDLRVRRVACGLALSDVAAVLSTSMNTISRLERAVEHDGELARRYDKWLSRIEHAQHPRSKLAA
jgi:transposase